MINIEGFINNLVTCLVAPLLELSVHRVQTTEWGRIFIKGITRVNIQLL